ncbi:unnamed protein product, partial [Protopolystoma xenopodis]
MAFASMSHSLSLRSLDSRRSLSPSRATSSLSLSLSLSLYLAASSLPIPRCLLASRLAMATYRSELYVPVEVNNYDYLPTHQQERHLGRAETRGVPQQRLHRYPSLSNICSPTMHSDLGSSAGANPGYSTVGRPAHSGASSVADWSDLTTGTGRVASGAGSSRSKGPMEATYLPVHAGYGQLGCGDAWYDEMKRRFDERRRRWDENVKRMRDEFFRDPFDATPSALADSDRKVSCMESQPVVTNYERGADEQMHFIAKFVVSDFAPELVKVSVRQSQLVVSARLEQQAGATSSSREFTKSIDLPRHVIETQISATVTADGVLVVDCPLRSGLTGAGSPSPAAGQTRQDSDRTTGLTFKDRQSPPAFAAGLARPPVPG